MIQPMWKSAWRFLEKIKTELPYNPAISPVGFYSKKIKTAIPKDICTFMFTAVLFTIAKTWKQPRCPSTEEWIKKMWYIYTMKYCAATCVLSNVRLFVNHRICQARTLAWVALSFSRGSSQPGDQTGVSHVAGRFFTF